MKQWKVGTISLGLLLILLGGAWIYSSVAGIDFFTSIFKWWPVVLIILGLEILIFSLIPSNEDRRIKLHVPSIIIIIFIIIFLGGAQVVTKGFNYVGGWINNYDRNNLVDYSFTETFPVNDIQAININGAVGDVEITEGSGEVITLDVKISYNDEKRNSKIDQQMLKNTIKIDRGNSLAVSTQKGNLDNLGIKFIDYVITIPKAMDISVENNIGNTEARNITGRLNITSNIGDVSVNGIKGDVAITNNLGDIVAFNIEGSFTGKNDAGSITARDINGNADIHCRLGEVEAENIKGNANIENNSGSIVYSSDEIITTKVDISNNLGEVTLNLNKNQEGYFDVRTDLGDISTSFLEDKVEGEISQKLNGKIGNSSATFTIKNNSGSIEINN